MTVYHVQQGKEVRLSQPQQFMAQERTIVEEAYAGDIIGVFDPGIFHIGDTLSEGNSNLRLKESQYSRRTFRQSYSGRHHET